MDLSNLSLKLEGPELVAVIVLIVSLFAFSFFSKPKKEKYYPMIIGMATGNPKYCVKQSQALDVAMKVPQINKMRDVLERIYGNSKIGTRYMSVPDFTPDQMNQNQNEEEKGDDESNDELFYPEDGSYQVPVETRLEKFKEVAVPLVTDICKKAIEDAGLLPSDIGKLCVVSSTGFLGPGLVGFMGCAAAMNGFRIAMDYCTSHPGKKALMVCVEISSVHTTFEDNINDSILHAIFADGCAAAVLEAKLPSTIPKGSLVIDNKNSWLMESTEDGITLSINANGISCCLSKHLPSYIAKGMPGYVDKWLEREGMERSHVDFWAVHPGGRRIIEEAQNGLNLSEEDTADSWAVLDKYGNMLSPSVMFVLQRIFKRHWEMRDRGEEGYKCGLAFSFSPGVGAEGIMLKQIS